MNKIFSMNKKLIERVLLMIFLGASFAISPVSYAAPKFASLYQQGGIGRCITEARRAIIYLDQSGDARWQYDRLLELAGFIFATGRIGDQPDQLTEQEFVELLDATPLAEAKTLPTPNNSSPLLSTRYQGLPVFTIDILKELLNKKLDNNKKIVVHGGGLLSISNFLFAHKGYVISNQTDRGMWVAPLQSSMHYINIYGRTIGYACRNTPKFFDQPTIMVATIEQKYIRNTQNEYEKVINESNADKLQDVKIYRIAPEELKYDSPGGMMNFDNSFDYTFCLNEQASLSLYNKLSHFRCDEKFVAQVEYYFATGEILPTLAGTIGAIPTHVNTAAANLNPNITDNAGDRANAAAAPSWWQGWGPSSSTF